MSKVLLINHGISKQCGIYDYGLRSFNILRSSLKHEFIYGEVDSLDALTTLANQVDPDIIVYNQSQAIMSWCVNAKAALPKIKHIGIIHDVTQEQLYTLPNFFDARIALDFTLSLIPGWYSTIRPLFGHKYTDPVCGIPDDRKVVVGSFGFYFPHKNYEAMLDLVPRLIPYSKLRLHITKAHFSNNDRQYQDLITNISRRIENHQDIELSTEEKTDIELIDFLNQNDLNLFLYAMNHGSGPGSAIDHSVAAGKPIITSESYQFRHVKGKIPTINEQTLLDCVKNGNGNILRLQSEWDELNFLHQYEEIIDEVQNR